MKSRAFTLLELLVVISIITLLTAILIPSLRVTRRYGEAALCKSNVRQLAFNLTIYETDNETFPYALDTTLTYPPPSGYPGNLMFDRLGWWWFHYIIDYSKRDSESIICCPSRHIRDDRLKYNVLCGNYGVNQSICKSSHGRESQAEFVGKPLCSGDILHPSQTFLVADSGYSMISWWHAADVPPESPGNMIEDAAYIPGLWINKDKSLWPGQEEDAIDGRHPNKTVNVGFADGQVSRVKADVFFVEKTGDTYKNLRPLWLPE
jgi:prepilin-type N-terminal cleavage/methylation domain-containing protein/prepilin-type processing-associated H-X9-DG protein